MESKPRAKKTAFTAEILELELVSYMSLAEKHARLTKEQSATDREFKSVRAALIARLKMGQKIEEGSSLNAFVDQEPGQCRPAWKDLFLDHMKLHGVPPEQAELDARNATEIPVNDVLKVHRR